MPKTLPPVDYLHKLLRYDPETGKLYWRERTPDLFKHTKGKKNRSAEHSCKQWNHRYSGREAFTASMSRGARTGRIDDSQYLAHRIAYVMYFGDDISEFEIDHINGDPSDNRAVNLRKVTRSDQAKNMPLSSSNTSGAVGVFFISRVNRWGASIQADGKSYWLGYYDTKNEAVDARTKASQDFGFHHNHGRTPNSGRHSRVKFLEHHQV